MSMTFSTSVDYIYEYIQQMISLNKMGEGKEIDLRKTFVKQIYNLVYTQYGSLCKARKTAYNITTVEDQSEYTIQSDMFEIDKVYYNSGTDIWLLRRVAGHEMRANVKSLSSGYDPSYYDKKYQTAGEITLYPAPSNDGEIITVYGARIPDDLSADSDLPIIPANFHKDLVDLAIEKLVIMVGLFDMARTNAVVLEEQFQSNLSRRARKCAKQIEFSNDDSKYTADTYEDALNKYNYPLVNHSPIVNIVYYLNDLEFRNHSTGVAGFTADNGEFTFYNDITGAEVFQVNATSMSWMGVPVYSRIEDTPDSDNYDYTYAGSLGSSYWLTVYAINAAADAMACYTFEIVHWAATATPDVSLLTKATGGGGTEIVIGLTPSAGSANITINVTNADAGDVTVITRNGVSF